MGAADEGCSGHAENAEHSPEGREWGQGSAPAGDPDAAVPGRRDGAGQGAALCLLALAGEAGNPAPCAVGWDSTASVPWSPRGGGGPEGYGHGERVPPSPNGGNPISSGSVQAFPHLEEHVAEQDCAPRLTPTEPPRPEHLRLPPQERADAPQRPQGHCPPPPQLLPAVHLEMVCIALLRPLRSLLPAGIKGCRPAVETHCLLARSLAVPAPPTPPPSLPPRHPPAISQLEEGQPQQSHSRPGCCLNDSPAMPQMTPISSCPATSLHPASLRAGGDALHPQRQAAAPQGRRGQAGVRSPPVLHVLLGMWEKPLRRCWHGGNTIPLLGVPSRGAHTPSQGERKHLAGQQG